MTNKNDRLIVRLRKNKDEHIGKFIDTYSSTKGIDRSTTIRILLEYGITLALQEMYEESD